jgi:hypothetical protein
VAYLLKRSIRGSNLEELISKNETLSINPNHYRKRAFSIIEKIEKDD